MLFHIGDLPVLFPYPSVYPEQFAYMCDLKKTLDVRTTNEVQNYRLMCSSEARRPLRTGDAVGNWQNHLTAFFDCRVSTTLPRKEETNLLFTYNE